MPQGPEAPQDEASNQRTMQWLQTRLRETAPPWVLEQWSSDENHKDEGAEIGQHGQRSERLERFQGSGPEDYRGKHHNHRDTDESEQVPQDRKSGSAGM